ncbi:DUF4870 domain-containing protein [Candidatus Marinimicrobia bacterium PRS2]|nr:DUF4870 domain-containing protein [Candidatus Marinimicrobia bacterium PRS2]
MSEESTPAIETTPSKDERTWAMLSHFSGLCMFIFPLGNILAPLIIWLIKKEEMSFVEDQAKEVLNFQISMTIYLIGSLILIILLIGIPILIGLVIFNIIITIIAGIKANDGKYYRYPLNLRLVK